MAHQPLLRHRSPTPLCSLDGNFSCFELQESGKSTRFQLVQRQAAVLYFVKFMLEKKLNKDAFMFTK